MARVLITGSSDGLGLMAGKLLCEERHRVVLHARNERRADDARRACPGAEAVVIGDFSRMAAVKSVAEQALGIGAIDSVIHNAALGYREALRKDTEDGIEIVFAVNVAAPYLLTALLSAKRLVYLSSGLHRQGTPDLSDVAFRERPWSGFQAYSDSKLYDTVLAFAFARRWPDVFSNSVEPGWVATKMGGAGAPDDLSLGPVTQAWLAVSDDPKARVSGRNFFHQKETDAHPIARDTRFQDALLARCAELTGVTIGDRPT